MRRHRNEVTVELRKVRENAPSVYTHLRQTSGYILHAQFLLILRQVSTNFLPKKQVHFGITAEFLLTVFHLKGE